jgi:hypothetical protein
MAPHWKCGSGQPVAGSNPALSATDPRTGTEEHAMVPLAAGAALAFGAALGLLAAFFATGNARFDRLAEWAFVAFALLAIPTMVAVAGHLPADSLLTPLATVIGIVGALGLGLVELLVTLGIVDFRRIGAPATAAFLAVLVWIGAVSILAIAGGSLPAGLGWLGLASIAVAIVIVGLIVRTPGVLRGEREPSRPLAMSFGVPMAGIVAWMLWLATTL